MNADYPNNIAAPRTVNNEDGVTYDENQDQIVFAEDINKLSAEIVAIETTLGINPQASETDVATRLDTIESNSGGGGGTADPGNFENYSHEIGHASNNKKVFRYLYNQGAPINNNVSTLGLSFYNIDYFIRADFFYHDVSTDDVIQCIRGTSTDNYAECWINGDEIRIKGGANRESGDTIILIVEFIGELA